MSVFCMKKYEDFAEELEGMRRTPYIYETVFVWSDSHTQLRTFYKVSPSVGYVPAGISFEGINGEDVSTARLIADLLPRAHRRLGGRLPSIGLKPSHWSADEAPVALQARFERLFRSFRDLRHK